MFPRRTRKRPREIVAVSHAGNRPARPRGHSSPEPRALDRQARESTSCPHVPPARGQRTRITLNSYRLVRNTVVTMIAASTMVGSAAVGRAEETVEPSGKGTEETVRED